MPERKFVVCGKWLQNGKCSDPECKLLHSLQSMLWPKETHSPHFTCLCSFHLMAKPHSENCSYAHGLVDLQLPAFPNANNRSLCTRWLIHGSCNFTNCVSAHGVKKLIGAFPDKPTVTTNFCPQWFLLGKCPKEEQGLPCSKPHALLGQVVEVYNLKRFVDQIEFVVPPGYIFEDYDEEAEAEAEATKKKAQEEHARKQKEEHARKQKEEQARKQKEEQARKQREEQARRQQQEEEERARKEREEQARRERKELEERERRERKELDERERREREERNKRELLKLAKEQEARGGDMSSTSLQTTSAMSSSLERRRLRMGDKHKEALVGSMGPVPAYVDLHTVPEARHGIPPGFQAPPTAAAAAAAAAPYAPLPGYRAAAPLPPPYPIVAKSKSVLNDLECCDRDMLLQMIQWVTKAALMLPEAAGRPLTQLISSPNLRSEQIEQNMHNLRRAMEAFLSEYYHRTPASAMSSSSSSRPSSPLQWQQLEELLELEKGPQKKEEIMAQMGYLRLHTAGSLGQSEVELEDLHRALQAARYLIKEIGAF